MPNSSDFWSVPLFPIFIESRIAAELLDSKSDVQYKKLPGVIGSSFTLNCLPKNSTRRKHPYHTCTFSLTSKQLSRLEDSTEVLAGKSNRKVLTDYTPVKIIIYSDTDDSAQFFVRTQLYDDYYFQECTFEYALIGFDKKTCVLIYSN